MPTRIAVAVASVLLGLVALVPAAEAHRRSSGGFDPADSVLACVRSYEQGRAGYATNTDNGRSGAYQMGPKEWRDWSALIPNEHWRHHGISRSIAAWEAPAAFQDEAARNGIRSRGLQPWPTPNRLCARTRR